MVFFYLFILAIVFLVVGGIYVLKGLKGQDEPMKVVPISDIKEIKEYQQAAIAQRSGGVSVDTITDHILKQNLSTSNLTQSLAEKSSAFEVELKNFREKVETLTKENLQIRSALEREVSSKKDLSSDQSGELTDIKVQLSQARQSNERLTADLLKLEKSSSEDRNKLAQGEAIIAQLREELARITSADHLRIQSLESKLSLVSENQAQESLSSQKMVLDRLSAENQELLFQIRTKQADIERLEVEKKKVISEYEFKMHQMQERISFMNQKLVKEDQQLLLSKLKETDENIKKLAHENKNLHEANSLLSRELKDLRAIHEVMIERERFLQYELTKTKAQMLGLEKLCQDFKAQIESPSV